MTRTRTAVIAELDDLRRDTLMRSTKTALWWQVYRELMIELKATEDDFDYDAATEATRQQQVSDFEARAIEDEHERRWDIDLHALANGPVLVVLVLAWVMAQFAVVMVIG